MSAETHLTRLDESVLGVITGNTALSPFDAYGYPTNDEAVKLIATATGFNESDVYYSLRFLRACKPKELGVAVPEANGAQPER